MAPGASGNGDNSRQTGTVPKKKSQNESSRMSNGASRREYFIPMPNNLNSMSWQPQGEPHSYPRTRKESNTTAARFCEIFETGEEYGASFENGWCNPSQYSHITSCDDDEILSWAENRCKSNNIEMVDKSQVGSRLQEIREYVSQTRTMMDSLRGNGGQRNMRDHDLLASMLEGLRDSELKLQGLYEGLQSLSEAEAEFSHQHMDSNRDKINKSASPVPKTSDSAQRNELKKRVQVTQLKLQELQEQQAALKALRHKAQGELIQSNAAQLAALSAYGEDGQAAAPDRLQSLQHFYDTRDKLGHSFDSEEREEASSSDKEHKLDELQAKKQQMDQWSGVEFSQLNGTEEMTPEECERDVENKMAELKSMRETLAILHGRLATPAVQNQPSEPRTSTEKSNASSSHQMSAKSHQLTEAKAKLHQLQTLLQTVEELRETGQPIPEPILQLMSSSDLGVSPTVQDRPNLSTSVNEQVANDKEVAGEHSFQLQNSVEGGRRNRQLQNAVKQKKHERILESMTAHLEDLYLRYSNTTQNGSNYDTTATWGSSTHGTVDDELSADLNESVSVKNVPNTSQTWVSNARRNPLPSRSSRNSETRDRGTSPLRRPSLPQYIPSDESHSVMPITRPPQQSDDRIVQQINQIQRQLQHMSGLYNNIVGKQHNCSPVAPWSAPTNISATLGPYCQYSNGHLQHQQLLVHSLNQCSQLIWYQHQELTVLKEVIREMLESQQGSGGNLQQPLVQVPSSSSSASNLNRRPLKPSLSADPSQDSSHPCVTGAQSLPNLTSPQTSPASPHRVNMVNQFSSPVSLPPCLNNAQPDPNTQFTDANVYPPYGNNLNFEFPSPENFFPTPPEPFFSWATNNQPPAPTTLNNQVPPGNRANNYWDNFRSYSRQNLLSNSRKSNDRLLTQQTPLERLTNTGTSAQPREHRSRKERLNVQSQPMSGLELARGSNMEGDGETASRYLMMGPPSRRVKTREQAVSPIMNQNMCNDNQAFGRYSSAFDLGHSSRHRNDSEAHCSTRQMNEPDYRYASMSEMQSGPSLRIVNENEARLSQSVRKVNENEARSLSSTRLVNESDAWNSQSARLVNGTRRKAGENETKFQQAAQPNNEAEETPCVAQRTLNDCEVPRGANRKVWSQDFSLSCDRKSSINKWNHSYSRTTPDEHKARHNETNGEVETVMHPVNFGNTTSFTCTRRNVNNIPDSLPNCIGDGHRNENKGNIPKECKTEKGDSLEASLYSEVAALISVNEWHPQFLLQLFRDLRLISASGDQATQAALSSLRVLATSKTEPSSMSNSNVTTSEQSMENSENCKQQQPRNQPLKDTLPQLPRGCQHLDWEVRVILVELLPYIKAQHFELCNPQWLEFLRKLILQLVPAQSTLDQLDAQLEDALHKFQGSRLCDVYEEVLSVVSDVLTSELTFLRLINNVNHTMQDQAGALPESLEEEEEGAVGGVAVECSTPLLQPVNQPRRTKSETVSEADLAEADQLGHTNSDAEERGDIAEGLDQLEEEACGVSHSVPTTESASEVNWAAVEQDRELGLDQVPTRLAIEDTEQDGSVSTPTSESPLM